MIRIDLDRNIPTHYAFLILLVIGFLVAWYITSMAENIVADFPRPETLHLKK